MLFGRATLCSSLCPSLCLPLSASSSSSRPEVSHFRRSHHLTGRVFLLHVRFKQLASAHETSTRFVGGAPPRLATLRRAGGRRIYSVIRRKDVQRLEAGPGTYEYMESCGR